MPRILDDIELVDASVSRGATFGRAVEVLGSSGAAMVAVLDEERRVAGLFGAAEALRGCLPSYVGHLHHTSFSRDDVEIILERAREVQAEPVERYAVRPVSVDRGAGGLHIGELFLHSGLPAVAVVEDRRFAGILDRVAFARALVARAGEGPRGHADDRPHG